MATVPQGRQPISTKLKDHSKKVQIQSLRIISSLCIDLQGKKPARLQERGSTLDPERGSEGILNDRVAKVLESVVGSDGIDEGAVEGVDYEYDCKGFLKRTG